MTYRFGEERGAEKNRWNKFHMLSRRTEVVEAAIPARMKKFVAATFPRFLTLLFRARRPRSLPQR